MKIYVIMLAGGKGSRMNASVNKVLIPVCGKTVIARSIEAFVPFADEMIIVSRHEEQETIRREMSALSLPFQWRFASAGDTRQASMMNGLFALSPSDEDIVLIHDAARCMVDHGLIRRVIDSVKEYGTGIPGIRATSTYKICDPRGCVVSTPDRSALYEIQTPQGFRAGMLIPAVLKAMNEKVEYTDDAGIVEHYGADVRVTEGSSSNIKLTTPEDIQRALSILEGDNSFMRVGMGYDVHRLIEGRKMILCGIEIPYEFGLLGHSDADVALHALMDAMLGACALGDIGKHFPDKDERYRGISSVVLLEQTKKIIGNAGYAVSNADITIVAQKPKLLQYIPDMAAKVASVLELPVNCISVKATTTEMLGFEGRKEGVSAYAVCTVVER